MGAAPIRTGDLTYIINAGSRASMKEDYHWIEMLGARNVGDEDTVW
jgi:hypothetical protein